MHLMPFDIPVGTNTVISKILKHKDTHDGSRLELRAMLYIYVSFQMATIPPMLKRTFTAALAVAQNQKLSSDRMPSVFGSALKLGDLQGPHEPNWPYAFCGFFCVSRAPPTYFPTVYRQFYAKILEGNNTDTISPLISYNHL